MGRLQFPTVALGLNSKKRPTKIPLGACQSGSKNFILDRDVLATAPGYKTIVTQRLTVQLQAVGSELAWGDDGYRVTGWAERWNQDDRGRVPH